jgi:predicted short-subunit dehydrogenase-like oxidoreductase (DUF2520 family)
MRITLIGSGNVATHFAAAFKNAGHKIIQVYSKSYQNAALLAYHVGAEAADKLEELSTETDIFIIAVKDDVIGEVAQKLAPYQKPLVHTSGATDMQVILKSSPQAGVLYPLQTFSKVGEVNFREVPLCIEASTDRLTLALEQLSQTISNNVYRVDSQQRKILHLAAVFACNFPNNLYGIAQMLLAPHRLDFNMLRPLILETAQKVQQNLPPDVQTGPAIRNDEKTMAAHLQLLGNDAGLQQIYELLSQSIIKMGIEHNADK